MHEEDAGRRDNAPTWVPARSKPRELVQGSLGTIADTVAGDIVVIQSLDKRRVVLGLVGYKWFDGSAHVHLSAPGEWIVNHGGGPRFVQLAAGRRVRFLGLRPWTTWHESEIRKGLG